MGATSIEWTDESLNPLRARGPNGKSGHHCVKVSPGCKNCYSSMFQPRLGLPVFQEQRREPPELFLDVKTLLEPLKRRKPTKFFWCDMTDMFGEWVPFDWIAACFGVMAATPRHTHQVLTKRPARALEFFDWLDAQLVSKGGPTVNAARGARWHTWQHIDDFKVYDEAQPWIWPLPNVWLGVSVEDQQRADERIPPLLRCPAAVRFLSCEPLLGPLNLLPYLHCGRHKVCPRCLFATNTPLDACPNDGAGLGPDTAIDWVIVGGESGTSARVCDVGWIRSLVEQCAEAKAACFVKQLGARPIITRKEWDRSIGDSSQLLLLSPKWDPKSPPGFVTLAVKGKGGDFSDLGPWRVVPGELPREFPEVG